MKPINNWIVCTPLRDNTEATTESGVIKTAYIYKGQEGKHINRVFRVKAIPDRFKYYKNKITQDQKSTFNCPEWNTSIECLPGDIILTSTNAALNSYRISRNHLIDYTWTYMALREGGDYMIEGKGYEIIMLNGYMACEEIRELEWKSDIIINPDTEKGHTGKNPIEWGRVAYVGKANQEYYDGKYDTMDIRVGDVIRKRNVHIHQDLENDMYPFFDSEKRYFVIQRKDITAIRNDL